MTDDAPPLFESDRPSDPKIGAAPITPAPRWVKVFGSIVVVLLIAFIVLHLAGGGFGNHSP